MVEVSVCMYVNAAMIYLSCDIAFIHVQYSLCVYNVYVVWSGDNHMQIGDDDLHNLGHLQTNSCQIW